MTNIETEQEQNAIRDAIDHYARGMKTADVEVLREAFHQQAILCGYLGDDLIAAPIQALYDWVGSNPAPDDFSFSILELEVNGRVASAKAREIDSHGAVIDYFHLLKEDGRWSITSKLWDSEPGT